MEKNSAVERRGENIGCSDVLKISGKLPAIEFLARRTLIVTEVIEICMIGRH